MSNETVHVITDAPKPSVWKRIPTKPVVVAAVLVVASVAFAFIADHPTDEESTDTNESTD